MILAFYVTIADTPTCGIHPASNKTFPQCQTLDLDNRTLAGRDPA